MVNETFSAQRFGKYFKYDLKQFWHNNANAALGLGFLSVICYLIWVVGSLIFTGTWTAPGVGARLGFFLFGSLILVFYQTRTYGYLTEKKAGQAWLMLPASTLEKFISMLIITVLVIPCAYVVSYLALDSVIGLLDTTSGGPLVANYSDVADAINVGLSAASEEGFQFNIVIFLIPFLLQLVADFLYFLLCGICFKKWKILGGIAILIGLSSVLTPIFTHLIFKYWAPALSSYDYGDDPAMLADILNQALSYGIVLDVIIVVGLAAGIYYRLKTMKH